MCEHKRFDILFYDGIIMIRRCKDCGEVEVRIEHWTAFEEVKSIILKSGL